jgi:hypothetical protein
VGREVEDILRHLGAKSQNFVVESGWLFAKDLDEGLNGPGSMKVHGNLDDVRQARVDQLLDAGHWGHLDELLAQVVAKLVHHDVGHDIEHHMN